MTGHTSAAGWAAASRCRSVSIRERCGSSASVAITMPSATGSGNEPRAARRQRHWVQQHRLRLDRQEAGLGQGSPAGRNEDRTLVESAEALVFQEMNRIKGQVHLDLEDIGISDGRELQE